MNTLDYYESINQIKIDLLVEKKDYFNYVSKTSIHSSVTDWAYGVALERECVDISDGKKVKGEFRIEETEKRFYLKIIACMPDWQKYVLPITVAVNGEVIYNNKETFFEQVNLGWPALYISLPENTLKKGKNEVTVKADGGLYLSELSLISFPEINDLAQVSIKKYVKAGDKFAVAVKDVGHAFSKTEKTDKCIFVGVEYYKDLCILVFKSTNVGKCECKARFGDKTVSLIMPEVVLNDDRFLCGIDSDDHRHDDSDETAFIIETAVLSGMGNFIQFRPHKCRNFYKLADRKTYEKLIGFMSAFGIKYGLADSDRVMGFLPEINPEMFYGYHIHEPYQFFTPALLDNPYEKDWYFCDPEKINSSESFGESQKIYMDVLRRSKEKFAKGIGLTSFGSPSLLCVYEGDAGVDRLTIEPVSNINLLTGTVRATSVRIWGAHIPTDWYFGVPVDKVKANKYRLAMQYLYLNGASYIYSENSLFKTNAFERCDWESEFCRINREYLRDFYNYTFTHPRKGKLKVDKAIVYGRHEFIMWKTNDRMAELKENDWDSAVWGKWDNAYQVIWNASEAWLPVSDKQNEIESPLNKNLFSGTPYGNVDIVSAEKDFSAYSQIVFLGWNTMDDDLLERLKEYVENGGTLVVSYCHFNYTDRNDAGKVFPKSEDIKDFIGLDICKSEPVAKYVRYDDGNQFIIEEKIDIVTGKPCGAKAIAVDDNGNGVVYENSYGNGKIYFVGFKDYIENDKDVPIVSHLLKRIGKEGGVYCNNSNISFTVRETDNEYYVSVLNMNCIEGADEVFNLDFKGYRISGKIKVGEIKEYTFKKI